MTKHIHFHAKQSKEEKKPDHTLVFHSENGNLILGYSRARKDLGDSYSKFTGITLAEKQAKQIRMRNLNISREEIKRRGIIKIHKECLKKVMPKKIVDSLEYYVDKAKKVWKIDHPIEILFRGDRRCNKIHSITM